jgi:hypothetical protein
MSQIAAEAVALIESLPDDMVRQILDYARQLAEAADDAEWDRISSEVVQRDSFKRFSAKALADIHSGRTEPLDLNRL